MNERLSELEQELLERKDTEVAKLFYEYLQLRREKHRDTLERNEDTESRGRAKECKEMIQLFS